MPEKKPPRYFHGSPADLQPGQVLRPGAVLGRQNWPDKENHAVFMVRTSAKAKVWAGNAAKNAGKDMAHVYEVEPLEDVEKRRTPWEGDEHLTGSARVIRRVSSHLVTNPGREVGVFGDVPAKLAPVPKVVTHHVEQAKGQRSLFSARSLGPATENDKRVRAAENERNEPPMTPPTPPSNPRTRDVAGWDAFDHQAAQYRRYQGLPPAKPVENPFKRGRR